MDDEKSWVVRLCKTTNEDKWYFIDNHGNINARMSSAMRLTKEEANKYADAINDGKIGYIAIARRMYKNGKLWQRADQFKIFPTGNSQKGKDTMVLRFKRLSPTAKLPSFAHSSDSGMDISSDARVEIPAHSYVQVSTGIAAIIPQGYELQVRPRSGLQFKHGIVAGWGTVDEGYRGEIRVAMFNHTDEGYVIEHGDRVAQLVMSPVVRPEILETTGDISGTDRGSKGFGSTGK